MENHTVQVPNFGDCRDSGVWAFFVVTGEMVTNCYAQGATPLWVDPVSVACLLSSLLSPEEGEELLYSYQPIWWVTSGSPDVTTSGSRDITM